MIGSGFRLSCRAIIQIPELQYYYADQENPVYVEGHLNGSVSGLTLVNTKSLTELAEENPELASGVLKGGRFRPWWVA